MKSLLGPSLVPKVSPKVPPKPWKIKPQVVLFDAFLATRRLCIRCSIYVVFSAFCVSWVTRFSKMLFENYALAISHQQNTILELNFLYFLCRHVQKLHPKAGGDTVPHIYLFLIGSALGSPGSTQVTKMEAKGAKMSTNDHSIGVRLVLQPHF